MSIRQRLYPESGQEQVLLRHCSHARFVWNLGLEQRNCWRKDRTTKVGLSSQCRELARARQAFSWLEEGSSSVQQQALRDLDQAFQNWWNGTHSKPTWRKAGQNEGFCIRDLSVIRISRRWGEVQVPKCGSVRFRITRNWQGIEACSSARVTLDRSRRWHVSFTAIQPAISREPTGSVIGLDMGVASTATTSDGEFLSLPKLLSPGEAQRKRRLQRKLARQKRGSKRRARTKLSIARLSAKETDRRKDWIEKTTTNLVRDYDLIAIEDLKVKNMVRSASGTKESPGKNVAQKRGLNREIQSQSWSLYRKRLEQKADASGVVVVLVNPKYTSQTCSECGYRSDKNRESQAVFVCKACGLEEHADANAAKNILAAGLAVTARRGTPGCRSDEARTTLVASAAWESPGH